MSKGAYCLVMKLDRDMRIGRRPHVRFPGGFYCYVGSAMNSIEKRLCRHISQEKRLHWHIDWFLEHASIVDVKRIESHERLECSLSRDIAGLSDGAVMRGFGSSDCRTCESHLHYFRENPSGLVDKVVKRWKCLSGRTKKTGRR